MHPTIPPGFGKLPFGDHYQHFLLPTAVIRQLADLAGQSESEYVDNEEDGFGCFPANPQNSAVSMPVPFDSKEAGIKHLKVFDIAAINIRKKDAGTSRNVSAVMKRFKADDDGERELKKVPKQFMAAIKRLKVQYPNCVNLLDYVGSFAVLAQKQDYPTFYFPPVLLVGPPGVGKTAVLNEIAAAVGVQSRQVDLASTTAGMVLGGMSTQWSDAKTGVIVDLLRDGVVANPLVILDEIDKAALESKHNPLGPLYSLLEQHTAAKFIDEALDLPVDASHVLYVATANSLGNIPKAILSRFMAIEIYPIAEGQHAQVAQSIYEGVLRQHSCLALFAKQLSAEVIAALRNHSPRTIKGTLRRALALAAQRKRNGKKLMVTKDDLVFSSVAVERPSHYGRSHPIGFMQ